MDDLPVLAHIAILKAGQRGWGHDPARRRWHADGLPPAPARSSAAHQLVGTIAEQLFAGCTQRHEATMRVVTQMVSSRISMTVLSSRKAPLFMMASYRIIAAACRKLRDRPATDCADRIVSRLMMTNVCAPGSPSQTLWTSPSTGLVHPVVHQAVAAGRPPTARYARSRGPRRIAESPGVRPGCCVDRPARPAAGVFTDRLLRMVESKLISAQRSACSRGAACAAHDRGWACRTCSRQSGNTGCPATIQ